MFQHSQRYNRPNVAKGLKVKHVLQAAIVIVVLTWVTYELNLIRKPALKTSGSVFQDTEQDASLGRKALKPDGGPARFHLETEKGIPADFDDTVTKSSQEENLDGSRTEEDSIDQRNTNVSELDIDHASDQDEQGEEAITNDDAGEQHDVRADFEELKNEQARVEQEELSVKARDGKDGDLDEDGDSEPQNNEATIFDDARTEGGSDDDDDDHLASIADEEKKARETQVASFMEALNADPVLKSKLDELDEGVSDDTSRTNLDAKRDSTTDALEYSEDSGQEVVEEKSANQDENEKSSDQNDEEMSQKDVENDTSENSTESDTTEDNVKNQPEVEGTQRNLDILSEGQSDTNRKSTEDSVESHEEDELNWKTATQGQRQEPTPHEAVKEGAQSQPVQEEEKSVRYDAVKEETQSQQQAEGEEKSEIKLDTQSHVQEQEKKQEERVEMKLEEEVKMKPEEGVEKKNADDTQAQPDAGVKSTESNIQPELTSEWADVEVEKKSDETQASEGKNSKHVQPKEDAHIGLDGNQDRLATEKSLQVLQGTSTEKEEAEDHDRGKMQNDSESQEDDIEQKKYQSEERQ